MDADEFDNLAMRVLTGDASAREQAEFEQALAQSPALRQEFEELKAAREAYREFGPLAETPEAAPASLPEEQLQRLQRAVAQNQRSRRADGPSPRQPPAGQPVRIRSRLARLWPLRTGDRPRAALTKAWLAAAAVVALLAGGFLVTRFPPSATNASPVAYLATMPAGLEVHRAGRPVPVTPSSALRRDDRITVLAGAEVRFITPAGLVRKTGPVTLRAQELVAAPPSARPSPTQSALFQPLQAVLTANPFTAQRGASGLALYSPRGATASLTPLILWKTAPGKTWDITINDEYDRAAPPWRATAQTTPVEFNSVAAWRDRPLAASGLYKIILRETGNPSPFAASEYTFTTLPTATPTAPATHANAFLRAWQAANTDPPCLGDILATVSALPPELQDAEPILRLKLFAFWKFGLKEDHEVAAAKLRAIVTN